MPSSRRKRGPRPAAPSARRAILLLTAALLLLAGVPALLGGCGGDGDGATATVDAAGTADTAAAGDEAGEAGDESPKPKKEKAVKVDAAPVRRGDLVVSVHADGAIRTPREVQVRARVAGLLSEVLVRDGDKVRAGQLLARIDGREYELQLQEARSRRFRALSLIAAESDTLGGAGVESRYTEQHRALDRLRAAGEITEQELRDRLLELDLSALEGGAFRRQVLEERTGLAEAELAVRRAELSLEYCEIRAPFAGIVQDLAVVPGEIVAVGAPVCSLFDNDRLEAVVNVLEADLGDLSEGRPALLAVPATGDTVSARVDVLSPSLDPASRTCEAILRFDNAEGRLRPGMFVRAEIAGWVHRDKLLVPREAVLTRDDRPLVFKVEDGRARWLYVTLGLQNDQWVEITAVHSGGSLAPGDLVVVSDHLTLAHEALLDVRRTRHIADRWQSLTGELAASQGES